MRDRPMPADRVVHLRTLCRTLPEVTKRAGVRPVFGVGHTTCALWMAKPHRAERVALWCRAGSQGSTG